MTAIRMIQWLTKTRNGRLVSLGGVFLLILVAVSFRSPKKKVEPDNRSMAKKEAATKATSYTLHTDIPKPVKATATPTSTPLPAPVPQRREEKPPPPLPMRIYATIEPSISEEFLPYGRLVPCELVNTVDSSHIATPIIGLVTEDVWQGGNLIIPAGTEVHGIAQFDRSRDRISSQAKWTLVWQADGRELSVEGIALDAEPAPDGSGWGLTDGSAGLRGMTLRADKYAEIKQIIATALAAGAAGFVPTVTSVGPLGSTTVQQTGSWQTALAQTVQAAGDVYARQILKSIEVDGVYVRVPAGKPFYLYIGQTVDLAQARRGGSVVTPSMTAASTALPVGRPGRPATAPPAPSR